MPIFSFSKIFKYVMNLEPSFSEFALIMKLDCQTGALLGFKSTRSTKVDAVKKLVIFVMQTLVKGRHYNWYHGHLS